MAARAVRDARVTAPFAGLIARRFVSRGEFVAPGAALFELVSLDPIEVEFHLPEVDSSRVRIDQAVEVRVAPHPDEVFRAAVTLVSPTIDPRTRTLRVKAELENSEGRLRPGLFARVDLGIATRRGVAMVPEEAVLRRADGAVVFRLVAGDRVERLVIETGTYRDGTVEVVRGLQIGDRIVSKGHSALVEGERVSPRKPDGSPVEVPSSELADAREGA
jgi:membrane fusion protein (multidrug efflux system)